ncbi:ABC transporter ATP-binding protein [Solicola gregarius]|uniref:ABC transporter ATP-binding protein n=1 Tax=Solicola gregarius TaxID=2908642 RepID=A0AA46YLT3_9ACTN|nr:ABC transporter ATP-binding protein [Solicola gregarius]UYM06987.1 ABC transporter ATP-binding protein [Solicola gregarius]
MSTLSHVPAYADPHTITAVAATGLVKQYGDGDAAVRALDGVDLAIESGRFTAIMGPSGSGKSTLMHCLAGLDQATEGAVRIAGVDLSGLSDNALTDFRREHVGFVFQAFNLLPMLTAKQNILLPLDLAGRDPDWAWFDETIGVLGLAERLDHRPAQLSGGQQQRVAVARALLGRPEVIFADEPTGNLDRRSSAEVLAFLRRAVRELGQTVVMVTHDPVAATHADRVVLIADGRVAGSVDAPDQDAILAALRDLGE